MSLLSRGTTCLYKFGARGILYHVFTISSSHVTVRTRNVSRRGAFFEVGPQKSLIYSRTKNLPSVSMMKNLPSAPKTFWVIRDYGLRAIFGRF